MESDHGALPADRSSLPMRLGPRARQRGDDGFGRWGPAHRARQAHSRARSCGACHGSDSPPGPVQFTDDIDLMVEPGVILPLRSDLSPLIRVIIDGNMPSTTRSAVNACA
jgi:hypothetical protein